MRVTAKRGLRVARLVPALAIALALFACTPIYNIHGFVPAEQDLALIEVGVDTRRTVEAVVGRPSSSGLLTESAWYYVQSRWKTVGAAAAEELDRQVLAISFDEAGKVENIERFTLKDGNIVPLSRRVTESNIKGIGFLRQLLGNLGKLSADQVVQ